MFVFAHLFPDISTKSTKLHFQSWKKNSPTISLFFRKMTAKVSRNNCQTVLGLNVPLIYFRHLKVFVYLNFNIPPYQTKRFDCGNVWEEKTIELT